jgi:hypothetical protein
LAEGDEHVGFREGLEENVVVFIDGKAISIG